MDKTCWIATRISHDDLMVFVICSISVRAITLFFMTKKRIFASKQHCATIKVILEEDSWLLTLIRTSSNTKLWTKDSIWYLILIGIWWSGHETGVPCDSPSVSLDRVQPPYDPPRAEWMDGWMDGSTLKNQLLSCWKLHRAALSFT